MYKAGRLAAVFVMLLCVTAFAQNGFKSANIFRNAGVDSGLTTRNILVDGRLTVSDAATFNGAFTASFSSGEALIISADGDSFRVDMGTALYLLRLSTNNSVRFAVDSTGNVRVIDNAIIGLSASAARIEFDDQATDEINFLSANIGIGTSTPGQVLDVNGTANATTLTEGGNAVFNSTETPGGELGNTWASPTIDADAVLWNEVGDAGANGSVGFGDTEQIMVSSQTSGDVAAITLDINQADDGAATDDLIAISIDATSESDDAGDTFTLLRLLYENGVANTVLDRAILIDNAETTASTMTDAIQITSSGVDGGIVDAIDVSASNITNAINIGANNIITGATTIASTELDRLDGKDAALVDTNDEDVIVVAAMANGDWGAFTITTNVAALDAGSVSGGNGGTITDGSITADDLGTNSVAADEIAADALLWNEIGDAGTDATIANGANETDFTSTIDAANEAVVTITNTDDDAANDNALIDLRHNDGADANVFYLRMIGDNDGTPTNDYLFSQTGATYLLDLTVPTEAYDATGWNGDNTVPTKDAVRDKLEVGIAIGGGWTDAGTSINLTTITDQLLIGGSHYTRLKLFDADNDTVSISLQSLQMIQVKDGSTVLATLADSLGNITSGGISGGNSTVTLSSGGVSFVASDSDVGDININTSDQFVVQNFSGGYSFNNRIFSGMTTLTLGVAATTFAVTKNFHEIDGDAGGNTIATITGGLTGAYLTLKFIDSSVIVTDDNTGTSNTINLNAAFTSTANDIMVLIYDGTSWYEAGSRSAN